MQDWFSVSQIDEDTYVIGEVRHWEHTRCYLLVGRDRGLLIDTGLGISDISQVVHALTGKTVTAVPSHVHWDHIGGLCCFPHFYVHPAELPWISGRFPLPLETVRSMAANCDSLPKGFDIGTYELFRGTPERLLEDGDVIDLGGRRLQVFHTPGHAPGHLCFWEAERGYLFTGDLVYQGMLFADYPSTDPEAYLCSLEKMAELPARRVFPGHHDLCVPPERVMEMRDAFRKLKREGMLCHGSGHHDFGEWSVRL